jgi:hypothetical protein
MSQFHSRTIAGLMLISVLTGCSQSVSTTPQAPPSSPAVQESAPPPETPPTAIEKTKAEKEPTAIEKTKAETEPTPAESIKAESKAPPSDDRQLLFSCDTENGKQILLYDAGQTIDYSFGRPNQTPELALNVPRTEASTWQWAGIGRTMTYSIEVPNGNVIYSVYWNFDRLAENRKEEAGVNVSIDQKIVSTVECSSNIVNKMQGVDLKKRELS